MSSEAARPDPRGLPRQRKGVTPQLIGRYPDHDVLSQTRHWDEVTRRLVLDRVERVPSLRFFTAEEAATLKAFCDIVTAQDGEPRIPVVSYIDEKLQQGKRDGWQYYDLPDDDETWRRSREGSTRKLGARSFGSFDNAPLEVQVDVVARFSRPPCTAARGRR